MTPASLLELGFRRVPDDDPAAERYRERRRREDDRTRERVERLDDRLASRPRLERAFLVALALVGVAALAAVPLAADGNSRLAGRLLAVALIALNGALIGYAASHVDAGDSEAETSR